MNNKRVRTKAMAMAVAAAMAVELCPVTAFTKKSVNCCTRKSKC